MKAILNRERAGRGMLIAVLGAICAIPCAIVLAGTDLASARVGGGADYPIRFELRSAEFGHVPAGRASPQIALDFEDAAPAEVAEGKPEETPKPEAAQLAVASSPKQKSDGLLGVTFDLSAGDTFGASPGDGLQVEATKPLRVNGAKAGTVRIRVGSGSTIWVRLADLENAAGAAGLDAKLDELGEDRPDYLSFDALRAAGLQLRYDPVRDGIDLRT